MVSSDKPILSSIEEGGLPALEAQEKSSQDDISLSSGDDMSSHGNDNSTTGTGHKSSSDDGGAEMAFVKSENSRVNRWRHIVLLVLLLTAGSVTAGTYSYLNHVENESYLDGVS